MWTIVNMTRGRWLGHNFWVFFFFLMFHWVHEISETFNDVQNIECTRLANPSMNLKNFLSISRKCIKKLIDSQTILQNKVGSHNICRIFQLFMDKDWLTYNWHYVKKVTGLFQNKTKQKTKKVIKLNFACWSAINPTIQSKF